MITRLYNHVMGRFCQARSRRALALYHRLGSNRALARHHRLAAKAEKFFRRIPKVEADARDAASDRAQGEDEE